MTAYREVFQARDLLVSKRLRISTYPATITRVFVDGKPIYHPDIQRYVERFKKTDRSVLVYPLPFFSTVTVDYEVP